MVFKAALEHFGYPIIYPLPNEAPPAVCPDHLALLVPRHPREGREVHEGRAADVREDEVREGRGPREAEDLQGKTAGSSRRSRTLLEPKEHSAHFEDVLANMPHSQDMNMAI